MHGGPVSGLQGVLRHPGRSLPPEHSVLLRVAAAGAVGSGIVACLVQGLLHPWIAFPALALVACGGLWSYSRRTRPVPYVRAVLAVLMIGAFAWFFVTVSADAPAGALVAVEAALAVLFCAMQAAHAFDLPTRRDLGFAIAGSATLVALASTQAVSLGFGALVAAWAFFVVVGLSAAWASMAGGGRVRVAAVVPGTLVALGIATAVVLVLPPPAPPTFAPTTIAGTPSGPVGTQPSHMVPTSGGTTHQTTSTAGPTGMGGFLGFAGPLDTALRASLGNEVVLRVRADRPSYWLAETFDTWSGRSWTQSARALRSQGRLQAGAGDGTRWETVTGGPPLVVGQPLPDPSGVAGSGGSGPGDGATGAGVPVSGLGPAASGGGPGGGSGGSPDAGGTSPASAAPQSADYQTFYLATSGSNLVLHASQATAVWFPTHRLYVGANGTIESSRALGAGSVYTVLSTVETPTPRQLRTSDGTRGLTPGVKTEDLELPHHYPRVAALARRVTAGSASLYADVTALERWIGAHTTYTTAIPPLRPGQDTVDQFLFGSRRGYCEQISTTLAVMLRTLGIPAREAVGYVPGPYDPLTGTYDVEAKDAHAWVQVWFPGYGWQSFDPTAYVPDVTPSSGGSLQDTLVAVIERIPLLPTLPVLAVLVATAFLVRRFRRRPRTWRAAVTRQVEQAARRSRAEVRPCDTLGAVAARVDAATGGRAPGAAVAVATATERAAWEGWVPDATKARHLVRDARRIRRAASWARARRVVTFGAATRPRPSWRRKPTGGGSP
jgi:protein-glutamine gamma-glutamyltransferase